MTLHIIGAGLAGLSAAIKAVDQGQDVVLHEAAAAPGGRCFSWVDATLGAEIDIGSHILLGANRRSFDFLARIGSLDLMAPCLKPLEMINIESSKKHVLSFRRMLLPLLHALPRLTRTKRRSVFDGLGQSGEAWNYLWRPLCISALNTAPEDASMALFRSLLLKSLMKGPAASTPFLAKKGLSHVFIKPALKAFLAKGGVFSPRSRLQRIDFSKGRIERLSFAKQDLVLHRQDQTILALPWRNAAKLLPDFPLLPSSPIVNVHFKTSGALALFPSNGVFGMIGGVADWAFLRNDVLSVTVSAAQNLDGCSDADIADILWRDCARALHLENGFVSFRVVRSKAATLLHTEQAEALRPSARQGENWALAGDWTKTGLPCTMESAILSGLLAIQTLAQR